MGDLPAREYDWVHQEPYAGFGQVHCVTFVRGLDEPEILNRFGGELSPRWSATLLEANSFETRLAVGFATVIVAARLGGWCVAIEGLGTYEGTRRTVLAAVSAGTEAISVHRNLAADSTVSYAVDGELIVQFDPVIPVHRRGSEPDRLLPLMREVGLDPSSPPDERGRTTVKALRLATLVTGVRLEPAVLERRLPAAGIAPLLAPPSARYEVRAYVPEVAAAIDAATPAARREAAAMAARLLAEHVEIAQVPEIAEALRAGGPVVRADDRSALGRLVRSWQAEAELARERADRVARAPRRPRPGRRVLQPGPDPDRMLARWRAGLAVRAAVLDDARLAAYEAIAELAYLPEALAVAARRQLLALLTATRG